MITSRFPIARTNPGGFAKASFWPGATGALAVLVIVPDTHAYVHFLT